MSTYKYNKSQETWAKSFNSKEKSVGHFKTVPLAEPGSPTDVNIVNVQIWNIKVVSSPNLFKNSPTLLTLYFFFISDAYI